MKPADSVTAVVEDGRAVFTVTSESGIGEATLARTSGDWPGHVTLRFRYTSGRPFQTIEGFELTTARLRARGGLKGEGGLPFTLPDAAGMFPARPAAGVLNVEVERTKSGLDVKLP